MTVSHAFNVIDHPDGGTSTGTCTCGWSMTGPTGDVHRALNNHL